MNAASPTEFGRYQLLERIAVGGMAELYKARVVGAHGFEKTVVIKRILPRLAADPSFVAMFIDEAHITGRLQHPKIVQVLELGNMDGELFIAMEFIDGIDALGLLRGCAKRNTQLPAHLALHVVHEVLDALDYAHQATDDGGEPLQIVHRDISPGNVLLSRRGDVKLADFGIASAVARQQKTQTGILKGKYGYMSPEQVKGAELDGRSDIFSVGVVLAEMLMNRRLFVAASDLDVLLMVRDARLDRLQRYGVHIAPEVRAIVERALARNRDDRFADAGAFRDAVADLLFGIGQRVSAADLAAYLSQLIDGQRKVAATKPSQKTLELSDEDVFTISGPQTQERRLRADEVARLARDSVSHGNMPDLVDTPTPRPAATVPFEESGPVGERSPDEEGELSATSPIKLLSRLAVERADGHLTVRISAIVKEVYIADGRPQFVSSNVARELFGEFLVARKAISRGELSMALAVMPSFDNKLGDTLVGLGLLKPLEAFRFLTEQVRAKLIDACTWQKGHYTWYEGEDTPQGAVQLHLDPFEILGAGARALSSEHLERWAAQVAGEVPVARPNPRIEPEQFRMGPVTRSMYRALKAQRPVRQLADEATTADERIERLQTLYLLIQSDLAQFK